MSTNQDKENLIDDYTKYAEKVQKKLQKDNSWVKQYDDYANALIDNQSKLIEAKSKFHQSDSLHFYTTIGNAIKGKTSFDVRYLGQSVGTIIVEKYDKVVLSVSNEQAKNACKYFKYALGAFKEEWGLSNGKAKEFRNFYKLDEDGRPRQPEHMVESAIYSELEKSSSKDKSMLNIQPVKYAGVRIHMKTGVAASKAGTENEVEVSDRGGEIDCLFRRKVKPTESRLVAIEIKDENHKNESFDTAMKQAISYAVFLRELIRSDAGDKWKKIWRMQNQYKKSIVIDAAVAMPEGDTKPSYNGERIALKNNYGTYDYIELHYIEIPNIIDAKNAENVKFTTSFLHDLDNKICINH